jgi:ribosomal protein S28E/S33
MKTVHVVGLHRHENGRSCRIHEVCGRTVRVGDILLLTTTTVVDTVSNEPANAIEVVSQTGCRCAFLPVFYQMFEAHLVGRRCRVRELLWESSNSVERASSHRNCGEAVCDML